MSKQTPYKNLKNLVDLGMVKISWRSGRAASYRIGKEHLLVRSFNEMVNGVSLQMAEEGAKKTKAQAVA